MLNCDAAVTAFAGAFLGCSVTTCLGAFGIASDIASASATLLLCVLARLTRTTGLLTDEFFPALYGGTFAGMTPIIWLGGSASGHPAAWMAALSISLSITCGLAFSVVATLDARTAAPVGAGCGGRSGAIAAAASLLFIQVAWWSGVDAGRFHNVQVGALNVEPWSAALGLLACAAGVFVTSFALRQPRIADGSASQKVTVASAAALSGLMILCLGDPHDANLRDDYYAGCFLGMSRLDRLKGWFRPVLDAFLLMILLLPVRALLPGIGGRLGLAAFAAVMMLGAANRAAAARRSPAMSE